MGEGRGYRSSCVIGEGGMKGEMNGGWNWKWRQVESRVLTWLLFSKRK